MNPSPGALRLSAAIARNIARIARASGYPVTHISVRQYNLVVNMTTEPNEPGNRCSWETRQECSRFLDRVFPEYRLYFAGAYIDSNR